MNSFKHTFIYELRKSQNGSLILKRFKNKQSATQDNGPHHKALAHFDDFYKSIFVDKWPSVRLALLSKPKFVAVINNLGDSENAEKHFQSQGAFDLRSFLDVQKSLIPKQEEVNFKNDEKISLDEVVKKQLQDQEIKEVNLLHPEGVEFKSKVDFWGQNNNEYVYKPEDARTSLEVDVNKAQIDTSRLILPDSKTQEAILREYIPATTLIGNDEYIPESDYYKFYQPKMTASFTIEKEQELDFPEKLKVFSFDRGDISDFPDPTKNILGLYNYLKVDGGELLAALALDVQPNDVVLDLCSSSANISYCIFQTLRSKLLVCANDKKGKIADLFSQYLFDFSPLWKDMFYVTEKSVDNIGINVDFDKVLVNVPSTNDRTSLFEKDNNIFHPLRLKTRLQLPQHQMSLLLEGLKLVRPGGTLVYTSSTLSPIQNDGVVNQALKTAWEEDKQEFIIKDLSPALRHTTTFFNVTDYLNLKFGTLVVPFLPVNFGPRYICKLVKKEKETRGNNSNSN